MGWINMAKSRSNYRPSMTLTETIWQTVNRGKLTPDQLEDEIDYSASALKRAGLDGDSGAGLNIRKLIPLMKAQKDYSILEHLSHHCGFILIPFPRGGRSKAERIEDASAFQSLTAAAVDYLIKYINNGASKEEAIDHLYRLLKGTVEVMEDVKAGDQISLDL
jgi:hypothetical protein